MSKTAKEINEEEYFPKSKRRVQIINTDQLEYTATTLMSYGTIVFAVVLGLGCVTYAMIEKMRK